MYARISEEYIYIYHGTINRPFAGVSFPTWAAARAGSGLHGAVPGANAACGAGPCRFRARRAPRAPQEQNEGGREPGGFRGPLPPPGTGSEPLQDPRRGCAAPTGSAKGRLGVSQCRFSGSVHYGVFKPLLNDYLSLHADKMISRLLSE